MGVGSDLMRWFARDGCAPETGGELNAFHKAHVAVHPFPAVTLRACDRLCAAGVLLFRGSGLGTPIMSNQYMCTKTIAELQGDLDYGTFDFIVNGFSAVRASLGGAVRHLTVESVDGKPGTGTAFVVHPKIALTARHCIKDKVNVRVHVPSSAEGWIEPVTTHPAGAHDLVGLVFDFDLGGPSLRVREPAHLEPVMTMGYPTLQGMLPTLVSSVGELAGYGHSYLEDTGYWITTCAMTGGSSGGPVLGADGFVLGVVSGLPETDDKVDPGRFGLMVPCKDALIVLLEGL